MQKLILHALSILNRIVPKSQNKHIFISSPDFSDNSFALFRYMLENNKNKQFVWLVDSLEDRFLYKDMMKDYIDVPDNTLNAVKILDKTSLQGMWAFVSSKYVFFTHGFYTGVSLPKSQIRVNLWHGMPLKAIGYLNKHGDNSIVPQCTYAIATSSKFQEIMAKVFDIPENKVIITGQPRYDLFQDKKACLERFGIDKNSYSKIIFWAPTYRESLDRKIKDGNSFSLNTAVLENLNLYAIQHSLYFIIKLHPMDRLNKETFEKFSHITILKNEDMLQKSCQLFSLLGEVDILITDFSSIYIDFLLLNRPILFFIPDFQEYMRKRGFVLESPEEWMPGPRVETINELQSALSELLEGKDTYTKQRSVLLTMFHTHKKGFAERIIKGIKYA